MRIVRAILAELWGLFVDDGSLALLALALVAVIGLLAFARPATPLLGLALLLGCCAILAFSTLRAGRR
jgi:hypothetical protein